jgi:catechol 2,3-dioxygenase-like lactoylglutathione lyase family enzyme
MIGYTTVGTKDLPRALAFYDALFADLDGNKLCVFTMG